MLIGELCGAAASGSSCDEAELHQIRLADVLEGDSLLADSRGEGIEPDGASAVALDYHFEHTPVKAVEAEVIDVELIEGEVLL